MSKTLKKIRNAIIQEYKPDKIILFGSRVWGKARRDSDYDLFIVKKGSKKQLHNRTGDIIRLLIKADIWTPVDALVYNQQEVDAGQRSGSQFFSQVLHNGRTLYERR